MMRFSLNWHVDNMDQENLPMKMGDINTAKLFTVERKIRAQSQPVRNQWPTWLLLLRSPAPVGNR